MSMKRDDNIPVILAFYKCVILGVFDLKNCLKSDPDILEVIFYAHLV